MISTNPKKQDVSLLWSFFLLCGFLCGDVYSSSEGIRDWPGFRGPKTDGSVRTDAPFVSGDHGKLEVVWRQKIGSGFSGVVVSKGYAVTMFSGGTNDFIAAFDASDGKEVWRYQVAETYRGHDGSFDGPIATPVIWNDRVIGFGPRGHLFSLDLATGKAAWITHVAETLKAEKPYYGFSSSPIIAGGVLILEIGAGPGKTIAGLDPATGDVKWTLGDDKINYQSPVRMQWKDREFVVATGDTKLYGIDPLKGEVVWEFIHQGQVNTIAAESIVPVPAGEGRLWMKIKQDASTVLQLKEEEGKLKMEPLWTAGVLRSSYSIPVFHNGYLYGYNGRVFSCVDAATGELKWRSRSPGDGFLLLVDDHLVVQTKEGPLHIGPASPEGWEETARIDLFESVSWTPSSWAEGAIFARSLEEMARVEWQATAEALIQPESPPSRVPATRFAQFLSEVENAADKNAVVEQFLASIGQFPLIEWPDTVHFLYFGDARDMAISGDMIGYRREDPMNRVSGTNLFYYTSNLEPDAGIHYRFQKDYEDFIRDPRNDRYLVDVRGQEISWFTMPGWIPPTHLAEAPPERRGTTESYEFESKVENGGRIQIDVYVPAGFGTDSDPLPVAYVFGGEMAQKPGQMKNSLDNILGKGAAPLIVVFLNKLETKVDNEDMDVLAPVLSAMTAQDVVPFVDGKYRTIRERSARATIGSGFAGFDAFHTALAYAEIFGKVAGQSVFMLNFDQDLLMKKIQNAADVPLQIYLDWGLYDLRATREAWSVRDRNQELVDFLRERGYRPAGGETHEGFNWGSWRNRTDRLLAALFPIEE